MATKRMFDKAIIDTDKFMDLPMPSKALYFLMGMEADDEGFVSYKKVMRIHGGNEDDIKILAAKNFVIPFPSGVVVITDWNKNNWLDSRRIKPTEYQNEKKLLLIDKENKYLLSNGLASIEENSIEQNRVEEKATTSVAGIPEIFKIFEEKNPAIKRMYGNKTQRLSAENLIKRFGLEKVLGYAKFAIKVLGMPYSPRITTPYMLETKWADLEAFYHESLGKKEEKSFKVVL